MPQITDESEELPTWVNEISDWRSALQKFAYDSTDMSSDEYFELDASEVTSALLTNEEIIEWTTAEQLSLENDEKNDPEVVGVDLIEPKVINLKEALKERFVG